MRQMRLSRTSFFVLVTAVVGAFLLFQYVVLYRQVAGGGSDRKELLVKLHQLQSLLFTCDKSLKALTARCRPPHPGARRPVALTNGDSSVTVILITPTYKRETQMPDLVRMSHTLMLVPDVFWILIEDADQRSAAVTKLLENSNVPGVVLNVATPPEFKLNATNPHWLYPRGAAQRNKALDWLRTEGRARFDRGVVYFADDDNTYSLKLFPEIRSVEKAGVWPVGLAGGQLVERPIVKNDKVIRWLVSWRPERPFAIDMAGFAINLNLILQHEDARFYYEAPRGYQESQFLSKLITVDDLEPKADNCTRVYVWHTTDGHVKLKGEAALRKQLGVGSDFGMQDY